MDILLYIASATLLAFTLWDVFITVFSTDGAGPFTRFWTRHLWAGLLAVHQRKPIHQVLSLGGPFVLLASILFWYLMIGLAIFMAVAADPGSVVNGTSRLPANLQEKLYFVSTTISSLGYGDWVPSGLPWTLVGTLSTLLATVVLTVSLSYVLSVLGAAIKRRSLAQGVFSMGTSAQGIIDGARLGDPQDTLKNYVLSLSSDIEHVALQHLAYPVLKYFHAASAELSPARAILLLSDSFFVMGVGSEKCRPPPGVTRVVQSSIDHFVTFTSTDVVGTKTEGAYPRNLLAAAQSVGVVLSEEEFKQALDGYLPLRRRLVALTHEDGWGV